MRLDTPAFPFSFSGYTPEQWKDAVKRRWRRNWRRLDQDDYDWGYILEDNWVFLRLASSRSLGRTLESGLGAYPEFAGFFGKLVSKTVDLPQAWSEQSAPDLATAARRLRSMHEHLQKFAQLAGENRRSGGELDTPPHKDDAELVLRSISDRSLLAHYHPRASGTDHFAEVDLSHITLKIEKRGALSFNAFGRFAEQAVEALRVEVEKLEAQANLAQQESAKIDPRLKFGALRLGEVLRPLREKVAARHPFPSNKIICHLVNSAFLTVDAEEIRAHLPRHVDLKKFASHHFKKYKGPPINPISPGQVGDLLRRYIRSEEKS